MVRSAAVQITPEDNPQAGHEHGILAREHLTKHAGRYGSDDTADLEDGRQPARGARGLDHGREVVLEAVHDERLAQDALLVPILEAAERGEQRDHHDLGVAEHGVPPVLVRELGPGVGRRRGGWIHGVLFFAAAAAGQQWEDLESSGRGARRLYDGLHKNRRGRNYMLNFLALDYLGMPLALILDPFGVSG